MLRGSTKQSVSDGLDSYGNMETLKPHKTENSYVIMMTLNFARMTNALAKFIYIYIYIYI